MQPLVPLAFEFQINGRVNLTVLRTGLHQTNLTVNLDIFDVDGTNQALAGLDAGEVAALKTAIKNLIISNQSVPA